MSLWRRVYESEIDLRIERWVAHRLGWHTIGCRGLCEVFWMCGRSAGRSARMVERGRWWRVTS